MEGPQAGDEEAPPKLTKPQTTPPKWKPDVSGSTTGSDHEEDMFVNHSTTTAEPDAEPDVEVSGSHESARAPAPPALRPGKTGLRIESKADGSQRIQWRILQSKVKTNFGQHLSPRIDCKIKGESCQILIILKEVPADDAKKDSARRDRRNQPASTCTIEVRLLSGLEESSDGIVTYSLSIGSDSKQTEPRDETHDFKKANTSRGPKDAYGRVDWNYIEAVDDLTKTVDVCLEFPL